MVMVVMVMALLSAAGAPSPALLAWQWHATEDNSKESQNRQLWSIGRPVGDALDRAD